MRLRTIHYGWIIAAIGFMVLFSCLGLARYAYTMLLPGMQAGLGLPYDRMGFIGTGNFVGYLCCRASGPCPDPSLRPRAVITGGASARQRVHARHEPQSQLFHGSALYTLVGMGSGFANIPLMALITYWFRSEQRGKAAGLVIGGNGAAIIFAGF